jgi:hypothetical protein
MPKYCTNCSTQRESRYEKYGYGSDRQCWYCEKWSLEGEFLTQTLDMVAIACGQRLEPYASGSHYCHSSGCHARIYERNYCSEHRPSSSLNWGYSFSSSASICQAEGCSRQATSSSQSYCQPCQQMQSLIRRVENKTSIRQVKDAEEFSAWWNNNLATVINGDGSFTIWLLVYDDKESRIRDFQTSSNHYGLSNAKSQAFQLRGDLNGDNPILYVHPKANSYVNFDEMVSDYGKFVVRINMHYDERSEKGSYKEPLSGWQTYDKITRVPNPSSLKPLDVVWVEKSTSGERFYHVGVYLGNRQVCHYSGSDKKQYEARIEITSWDKFVENCLDWGGETFAYRAVIPFKHYKQIAQQIGWAQANNYGYRQYCLANNNCEHKANSFVFGINYSKQVGKRPSDSINKCGKGWRTDCNGGCKSGISNNSKGSTIRLSDEIAQTNNQLGKYDGWNAQQIENSARTSVPIKKSWL